MKIALVFDDLIQYGGAERLLLAIHELYPQAPIYTTLVSDEWLKRCEVNKIQLITSFMQKLPFKKSLNRLYGFFGLHVLAIESFRFDQYDLVLSVSARFAHGVVTKPGTTHICYMNSPGRMFWEPSDYFEREGWLEKPLIKALFEIFSSMFLTLLRLWDYAAAQRVDYFIANSTLPKRRIAKYYHRDSEVIYPFTELYDLPPSDFSGNDHDYYLVITRLNAWKRVDIAIQACIAQGLRLKIIGEGPDRARLVTLSHKNKNIEFLGYVSEQEKISAIYGCKALIVTQKEDFGITVLEAMGLGKPVIAYRAGGTVETITEGVTGEFYDDQHAHCLAEKLSVFDPLKYNSETCINQARKFSKQTFMKELDVFVKNVYHGKNNLH